MRERKRIIWLFLIVALIFTSAGCGEQDAQKEEDPKEVYGAAVSKMNELNSLDFNCNINLDLSTSESSTSSESLDLSNVSMGMDMKAKILNLNQDNMQMDADYSISISGLSIDANMYYTDGYFYSDIFNQKTKIPMDVQEMQKTAGTSTASTYLTEDSLKECTLTKNEDSTCTIQFTADGSKLKEFVKSAFSSMEDTLGGDEEVMDSFNISDVPGNCTINADGYITSQTLKLTLSDAANAENTMTMDISITYNNPGSEVTVEFPDFSEYTEESDDSGALEESDLELPAA